MKTTVVALLIGAVATLAIADAAPSRTLFTNVHVFDGVNEQRIEDANVLVEGETITRVTTDPIAPEGATVIDGGGGTLMPGMIDNHWHTMLAAIPLATALSAQDGYINLVAADQAEKTLLRGFTTVRDLGGNSFSLKAAIDEGLVEGPRIYPSGPGISQTSGHADARGPLAVPAERFAPLEPIERNGHFIVADGVPAVLQRVREGLRMGASQVKIMAGGGTSSDFDPLDSTQYTLEEMKAAVAAAKGWNTYVAAHAYTPVAVRLAIEAGVESIEHGQMLDATTMRLVAQKGIWLSMQPFIVEDEAQFSKNPITRAKQEVMVRGTDQAYRLAKEMGVKLAWGTDILFNAAETERQGHMVTLLERWFTPFEILKMVTHDNAQLLKLSGPRDPYPGTLGVVEEGALADLILVEGNPLEDIDLVADPAANFPVIMKAGAVHKNTLAAQKP